MITPEITSEEFDEIRRQARAEWDAYYQRKRPLLVGRSLDELKSLRHKVRNRKHEVYSRKPYEERHGKAGHRLAFYELAISCRIEELKFGGSHEQR